jgi:hypothetical protein
MSPLFVYPTILCQEVGQTASKLFVYFTTNVLLLEGELVKSVYTNSAKKCDLERLF